MKYPLTKWQSFGRQVACLFVGHRYKSSWRRVRDEEPSWWTKAHGGNPYCEYVSTWRYRCRRCRRTYAENHPRWHQTLRWAVANWWSSARIAASCYPMHAKPQEGHGYSETDWLGWLAAKLLLAPLFGFVQGYGHFWLDWSWPSLPLSLVGDLEGRISEWVERGSRHYAWLPPLDPNDPDEIGFWLLSEQARKYRTHPEERPRMWNRSGNRTGAEATWATFTWSAS